MTLTVSLLIAFLSSSNHDQHYSWITSPVDQSVYYLNDFWPWLLPPNSSSLLFFSSSPLLLNLSIALFPVIIIDIFSDGEKRAERTSTPKPCVSFVYDVIKRHWESRGERWNSHQVLLKRLLPTERLGKRRVRIEENWRNEQWLHVWPSFLHEIEKERLTSHFPPQSFTS